jgi:hypothetical protein
LINGARNGIIPYTVGGNIMRNRSAQILAIAIVLGFFVAVGCTYKSDPDPKPPATGVWTPPPRPGAENYYGPDHVLLVEFTSAFG